jgi:hypothetical protein
MGNDLSKKMAGRIHEMEQVAKAFGIPPFDFYLLGGAACILGRYTDRATRDFDFIDLNYPSSLGRVFVQLRDFDMLEYESTALSPHFQSRAVQLEQYEYLNVYILSREDIIVSKIIRLEEKDLEDMRMMLPAANTPLILQIIDEILHREDFYESKKSAFKKNVQVFREFFHV